MIKEQKKIFLVDDNEANLITYKNILKSRYTVYPVSLASKMFELLKHVKPDLILLDIEMPDMNGYEAAKMLKSNDLHKDIPFIFLSGHFDPVKITEGMDLGACDFYQKPLISSLLLKRLEAFFSLIDYETANQGE